jgi:predicted RNA binding protein YcfA (HicA-like mRNA interferase family)
LPRMTPIPWQDFEKVLQKDGCYFKRQKGDHRVWGKAGLKRPVIFPVCELPVSIIQNNLKTLGLSRDKYFEYLK